MDEGDAMELHLEGQNVDVREDLHMLIAGRLEKLNARHNDIIHARVVLVKSSHHQQGSDEARIFLSLTRRKTLQASKVGKTFEEAVNTAFDIVTRELSEYRRKRRDLDKPLLKTAKVEPRTTGTVVEVFPEKGYGFIDIGAEDDVRFSRQVVAGEAFDSITAGTSVEVEIVEVEQGYEATRVVPLQTA
jgi:ribosome-associated translation inhibitor RaiA/cold shock CspA family protein